MPDERARHEYCQPVPHSLAFEVIAFRVAQLREAGERVPVRLCAASYLNDVLAKPDGEAVKKQSDYADIWGYSRSWVSRHWKEVKAEAEAQKDMYQKQRKAEREGTVGKNTAQQPRNSRATAAQQPRNSKPPVEPANGENNESLQHRCNSRATAAQQPSNTYRSHSSNGQTTKGGTDSAGAREGPPEKETPPENGLPPSSSPKETFERLQSWWNGLAADFGLPSVRAHNDNRRGGVKQRGREVWNHREEIREEIERSSFLRGEVKNWRVDFDFVLCTQDGYTKIIEGKYRDTNPKKQNAQSKREYKPDPDERDPAADHQRRLQRFLGALDPEEQPVGNPGHA